MAPNEIVELIRKEILDSRDTHIWQDYVNALRLISQVVFTRSSGFIFELIQNAEDSGQGLSSFGTLDIHLNVNRIKISHNGRAFNEDDVKAISGIRSSKKPERGFLGYLGIGFKSVLKISDAPEVYSNGFQFKFARSAWPDPSNTPWHVIPIWLDYPSELIDHSKTTFIISFREKNDALIVSNEIAKLRLELYLFLKWLRKISIFDEISGKEWSLESIEDDRNGITILQSGSERRRFKFFRKEVTVPDEIKADRLTQEYRANVVRREIAVGFALDSNGNLAPDEAGAMYGGVYSFLPLGEASSGAKFPIQADFLVQPGRDSINYEAPWNHWILSEIKGLCLEAIGKFREDDVWKYQFLPVFEFTHSKYTESYYKLFHPRLIEPVERYLATSPCAIATDDQWALLDQLVRVNEEDRVIRALSNYCVLSPDEIASAFGGSEGLKRIHPQTALTESCQIREVDRRNFLDNVTFLNQKAHSQTAADWFRNLYRWLSDYPKCEEYSYNKKIRERNVTYHDVQKFVLTSTCELKKGGEVFIPDLSMDNVEVKELAEELQSQKPMIHPDIFRNEIAADLREQIKGFLTGLAGCQLLNAEVVCQNTLLPKISIQSPQPTSADLIRLSRLCQRIIGSNLGYSRKLWVLTKAGFVKPASEVFFSVEFGPTENWESYCAYLPGLDFLDPSYMNEERSADYCRKWREFFRAGGVKDTPDSGVERFAINCALEKLRREFRNLQVVEKHNFGFDIGAETYDGNPVRVEVKGLSSDHEIELTDNESAAAGTNGESFYLCVVTSIPNSPELYLLKDPASKGKKVKLSIPVDIWKNSRHIG